MSHSQRQSCSVVVPVYNSEKSLPILLERLDKALAALFEQFEVVLVNDGSRDQSWQVIEALTGRYSWVKAINLMRNYGQHNALLCGIRAARYEIIVTMDDDLQNPPEEIPKLINKITEGCDVVYGKPQAMQHGLWRNLASQITKLMLQGAMGAENARNISAFRAFRTQVRDAFVNFTGPYVSIDVLLTWGTTRFAVVDVEHNTRQIGASNYTFRKLVAHALNMVTGFSILPLQFASWLGFGFALFGFILLLYVLGRFMIEGNPVQGFPFLASVITIFSGVQLFALGIIGEYLARMYFRQMERPSYAVRETIAHE
ncbi:MAG: glycosyltransferase family 2 protein [Chloroflexi bacterium]|nr:glycosyltransferase family 2 protein [Chloroflexota bacterium]